MSPGQETEAKGRPFDRQKHLREHPLFAGLPAEIIDRLNSHATMKKVARGATIFSKDDPGTSLFVVCDGTVKISVPSLEGKDAVFNLIGEGGIFGEIALLDGRPRTATAIAATNCHLMTIDRRDFVPLVRGHPELAIRIIEVLCARLRHTSEQVEDIMLLDFPARLAKALLRLVGAGEASSKVQKITITQREIGQIVGMSRESTNKQLQAWQRRKWIQLERRGIVILEPAALAALAALDDQLHAD